MRQILFNGHIYQQKNQFVSALLIQDGFILKCGSDDEILAHKQSDITLLDLQGKTVLPGFNDSHLHFYGSAVAFQNVELYGLSSIDLIVSQAQSFLERKPLVVGQTLFGRGWNQDYFREEVRLLTRFDLDRISVDFPIVFSRACGHMVTCNSKALEVLGINASSSQIEGGRFDVDAQGDPLGIFRENAIELLTPLQTSLSLQNRVDLLNQVAQIANQFGITSVQTNDINFGSEEGMAIQKAYEIYTTTHSTIRIYHQCSFGNLDALQERINEGYHLNENEFNRYGPLKLFIDGSLGARTALMRQAYHDDLSTQGILCMPLAECDGFVALANQNNIQIAIHAIGDGGIEKVLDAYQKVIEKENKLRHGIIHCQITDLPLLQRFKAMDIVAYVQPIFLHYDLHIVEDRVGKNLASSSYAFKTMDNLGLHVAYGTDAPVEGLNVFHNIHCAIHRQDLNDFPNQGFYPKEKVTLESAIDHLTCDGAYTSFEEHNKGRLLPGYLADLIVLDQAIFTMDSSLIKTVQVDLTMVNGQIVYSRQSN